MTGMSLKMGLALNLRSGRRYGPASLPNLAGWWDAADSSKVTLNASDVASIADKSGNARTAAQVSAGEQPAYLTGVNGINTKGAIRFTGANNDGLPLSGALGLIRNKAGVTFIGVIRIPTLGTTQRIFTVLSSTGNTLLNVTALNTNVLQMNSRRVPADSLSSLSSTATFSAATAAFFAASVNYATGAVFLQIDASTRSQTAAWVTGAANEDANHSAAPRIGRETTNTFTADLGELMIYDRVLSAAEISDLRTRYLKPKFALA
jgi:hypothetical protein